MTWNTAMGFISSTALVLPVICILALKLGRYKTFPALLCYYCLFFIFNLMAENYIRVQPAMVTYGNMVKNLADGPLMLIFLCYFSTSNLFSKKIRLAIALVIAFEVAVLAFNGFTDNAITIILGPVYFSIFLLSGFFFVRHAKIAITNARATGKAIISASLLFSYGCYCLIYLMYYVLKTQYVADTFLVYYLVVTVSSLAMCAGIIAENRRVRKLQEIKVTRKELSDIYKDVAPVPMVRRVSLDFDHLENLHIR